MLVGIIDMDLFINKKTFLPNPEVMLYSAYHKKKIVFYVKFKKEREKP